MVKCCPGLVSLKNKPPLLAFLGSGLKAFSIDELIQLFISNQSLSYFEKARFLTVEKSDVSSANILHIDLIPPGISFI